MKLIIVSPRFPPDHCGVGDQSARLAPELAARGHEVTVITSQAAPRKTEGVRFVHIPGPWGAGSLLKVVRACSVLKPDAILVQYTPYLYARRGIQPAFPAFLGALKTSLPQARLALFAHEPYFPIGLTPERLIYGVPQYSLFHASALIADHVFFSIQAWHERTARALPWRASRFSWRPISSAIDPEKLDRRVGPKDLPELLRLAKVPDRHKIILHFGGSHPTRLFPLVLSTLDGARGAFGPDSASLVFAGLDAREIQGVLEKSGRMDLHPFVHALGFIPDWQAALWLGRADLVVAPFLDGISTRRSSVMAAFAAGATVLTHRSYQTDADVPWEAITALIREPLAAFYPAETVRLLKRPSEAKAIGEKARAHYRAHWDWPHGVAAIEKVLCGES